MTSAWPDIVIAGGGIGGDALATVWLEPELLLCLLTTCSSARLRIRAKSAAAHECGMTLAFHAY